MALQHLRFDNRFLADLPVDPIIGNHRRQVNGACSSSVAPTEVTAPKMVAYLKEAAALLILSEANCESDNMGNDFTQTFVGNKLLDAMEPYACCYGGYQFGNWAGQLGDGRAINLGEIVNTEGERWALQLKGAGLTPYSRTADGLAVLRSSAREFLCSEAMYHLGASTTGAVVCRVAPSFTRFGSFQIHTSRGDTDVLKQLVDYTIKTDFPHLGEPNKETYLTWFSEIVERTALMVVEWMRVGFVHGVMNKVNPLYVLRNYSAQETIDAVQKDDFPLIQEMHEVLRTPYTEQAGKQRFAKKRPEWAGNLAGFSMLSCSS